MHTFGVHVRAKYAYLMEYNLRPIPHIEVKLEGGTADHTHYNLMGFTTTKTTGRYAGVGLSILSRDYFKPIKNDHVQTSFIGGFGFGFGRLNFRGNHTFDGSIFPGYQLEVTDENIAYNYAEVRLGFEIIIDRVVRFDIYPIQFTSYTLTTRTTTDHQYIPAIGVTKNGGFNPGLGVHIVINQILKEK